MQQSFCHKCPNLYHKAKRTYFVGHREFCSETCSEYLKARQQKKAQDMLKTARREAAQVAQMELNFPQT